MKNLQKAQNVLQEASISLNELISPSNPHLNLFIANELKKLINKIGFFTGKNVGEENTQSYGPVRKVLGEEISLISEITEEDLEPTQSDKELFSSKVTKLLKEIETMEPAAVVDSYSDPDGELVLRGVAKRVNIEGYEEKNINQTFVKAIQKEIKAEQLRKQEEDEIEKELQKEVEKKSKK